MSVRKLSPGLLELSIKKNNEDPSQNQKNIDNIRDWLTLQPHLKAKNDDQFLLNILRLYKFKMQQTKESIDMMYALKSAIPELTKNRDIQSDELQEILKLGLILPVPKLASEDAPRLIIMRSSPVDFTRHSVESIMMFTSMILDLILQEDDNIVIAGAQILFDLEGLSMVHVMHAMPFVNMYRKYVRVLQKSIKIRPCGYYLLNTNGFVETMFNMFKHQLEDKHIDQIKFCNESNYIESELSKAIIPKEYGGEGDTIEELTAHWISRMNEKREWFLEQDKYGTDENLRKEKISYFEEYAGVQGSFKNLSID